MNFQVSASDDSQLAPLKSWRIQPTVTRPAGPEATPVIRVSMAGWHGAQPRVITTPVWAVMKPSGSSMFVARIQPLVEIGLALGPGLPAGPDAAVPPLAVGTADEPAGVARPTIRRVRGGIRAAAGDGQEGNGHEPGQPDSDPGWADRGQSELVHEEPAFAGRRRTT